MIMLTSEYPSCARYNRYTWNRSIHILVFIAVIYSYSLLGESIPRDARIRMVIKALHRIDDRTQLTFSAEIQISQRNMFCAHLTVRCIHESH